MGRRLRELYRRIDRWQHRRGARIALSVLALLLVVAIFGPLHRVATRLERLEAGIVGLLENANRLEGDAAAVELFDRGTATLDGETYGDGRLRGATFLFDEAGAVLSVAAVAEALVADQIPEWAPIFLVQSSSTTLGWATLVLAWLLIAVWASSALQLVLTIIGTTVLALPFLLLGKIGATFAIGGMGLLGFSFVLLVRIVILGAGLLGQVGAVAATVIREAVRQKAYSGFMVLLLLVLPLIPLWIDPATPLRYQLQAFISQSLMITYSVAFCMTLVLACATVAFEIRDRQILQLMTKPLARTRYLLGKWLGIVLLNAVLMAVCGVSIFLFIQYLQTRPASDAYDAQAVQNEVLVARIGFPPALDELPRARLLEMIDQAVADDPILKDDIANGLRDEFQVRRDLFREFRDKHLTEQCRVTPGEERVFRFPNLDREAMRGIDLTLKYKFYAGDSDPHEQYPVVFRFPETGDWTDQRFIGSQTMTMMIPSELIGEAGELEVAVGNFTYLPDAAPGSPRFAPGRGTIFFDPDGLELLYPVSSFEANYLRAMLVTLIKLSFAAMLGVALASCLSFPVACVVAFTVVLAAEATPYLATSVLEYRIWYDDGTVDWAKRAVQAIASGVEWTLRSFGRTRPGGALVEGRLIGWGEVFRVFTVIGVGWSATVLAASVLAFRRKELAIYSGQA